jgi:hypothetical protein
MKGAMKAFLNAFGRMDEERGEVYLTIDDVTGFLMHG